MSVALLFAQDVDCELLPVMVEDARMVRARPDPIADTAPSVGRLAFIKGWTDVP